MKNKLKNTKGITLIALVITIIVLLILAGISITTLIGENGILNKTIQVKEKTDQGQKSEVVKLAVMDALVKENGKIIEENLEEALNQNIGLGKYGIVGDEEEGWNVKNDDELFSISPQGVVNKYEKIIGNADEWQVEGNTLVKYLGESNDIVIPNLIGDTMITEIGRALFANSKKDGTLTISEGIKKINKAAFALSCFSGELKIPETVTIIENNAFNGCKNLKGNLIIPDGVTSLGAAAFYECTGFSGKIKIGKNVNLIGTSAFGSCTGLTGDVILPDKLKKIDSAIFSGCSGLNGTLIIPKGLESIGGGNFNGTNIKNVIVLSENEGIKSAGFFSNFNSAISCWISTGFIKNAPSITLGGANPNLEIYTNAEKESEEWVKNWNSTGQKLLNVNYKTSLEAYKTKMNINL